MKNPAMRKDKQKTNPPKKKLKKMPKSSSSNPATMKFREAAKRKQGFGGKFLDQGKLSKNLSLSKSELTLQALEKHNAATGDFTESMLQDDATSIGGTTVNTWATNMTGCTNVTFNKVHRFINSSSAVHKEILAVLAAVTDVIREKGGEGKDVQYFAVLVTSLQEADKTETKMAMAHLLSIVIKKVPVSVLQSRFSQVLKTIMTVITDCVKDNSMSPLKHALSCLSSLLRAQPPGVWVESSTEQAYRALLAFVTHKKPKLRKAGQRAVLVVLRGSIFMQGEEAPPFHPAASITAKHCQKEIEATGGLSNRVVILHVLSLLKETMGLFPYSEMKSLCEVLLKLMTLTDLILRSSCMEILYNLFLAKPNIKALPAEMNGQMITALYDYQPSEKDGQPLIAWLSVMKSAAICLANRDPSMCMSHIPRLFSTCMTCLLSDRQDVATAAVSTMKSVLTDCVALYEEKVELNSKSSTAVAVQKVIKAMEAGLSYQFHSTWSQVFHLWATGFAVLGKIAPKLLSKCLTSMGDLRDTPHFAYKGEMELAIGAAVKAMGPKAVLEAIPLEITGENDNLEFPRGWLLPVMRDNVMNTELGFFSSYFLPLAAKLKAKAQTLEDFGRLAESRAYDTLQEQIWSLLNGFCNNPTDVKQSLKGIAKTLGTALNDREDLRMGVMASLRSLINCSLNKEEDKKEIGRFAKNFLPILFNQYTTEGVLNVGPRQAVLETVSKFLSVSDAELVATFLDKCIDKLKEETATSFRSIALIDITRTMIPLADAKRLKELLKVCLQRLKTSNDRTVQKKAYRVLEEMCGSESSDCTKFLKSNADAIRSTLIKSLSKSGPSTKAPRLRCLAHIFRKLKKSDADFMMAVLPEAILCTKEIGAKARAAAYELIVVISETFLQWNANKPEKEALDDFISKISAGLAGSPEMISATVLALTRIVYEYKARLSGSSLDFLVKNICVLLGSKNREVIKTGLGFIKVLLTAYDNTVLAAHLKDLLKGTEEIAVKGNTRRLTKIVYVKLIKKFGFEIIMNMTDQKVHNLIKNIHKTEERAKRQSESGITEDEDEEDDDESPVKGQPESIDELLQDTDSELEDDEKFDRLSHKKDKKKKTHGKDAWLMDTGEDEIVDFMDPSAAKHILTTKPKTNTREEKEGKAGKDRGFKMTPDGRLIITENGEEEAKGGAQDSEDDDLDDLFNQYEGIQNKSRKRKRGRPVEEDDDENDFNPSSAKYKAGGSGIHRPIAKAKKSAAIGSEYKSKKAGGDVKKAGRPDPYAYVPLNFNHLNKRKQMKAKGVFKNLVKGAKKGAGKGVKAKAQQGRRR